MDDVDFDWRPQRRPKPRMPRHVHILTLGDAAVGKSCLIRRFSEGTFYAKYAPTIGVDYGVKEVVLPASATRSAAETVALDFWDLSGHPDFYEVRNEFYRQAQAVLLVYDVQSRRSFDACGAWLEELRLFAGNGNGANSLRWFLVANKRDAQTRRVSERDGRAWAAAHSMQYFETSAFTGDRVADLFHAACDAVLPLTSP